MADDTLDNAAASALWVLRGLSTEKLGALYSKDGGFARTDTVTSGQKTHTKGTLSIPAGTLAALFHNHPDIKDSIHNLKVSAGGEDFSEDDRTQARKLGKPSFILTPKGKIMKFDPTDGKTAEVLAEFPWAEMKAQMMQRMGRDPSDPRGAYADVIPTSGNHNILASTSQD